MQDEGQRKEGRRTKDKGLKDKGQRTKDKRIKGKKAKRPRTHDEGKRQQTKHKIYCHIAYVCCLLSHRTKEKGRHQSPDRFSGLGGFRLRVIELGFELGLGLDSTTQTKTTQA